MAELIREFGAPQLSIALPTITRVDLTDAERNELVRALRRIVDNDQFQLSPRIRRLRQILDKLASPALGTEPFRGAKPPAGSSLVRGGRR
jgi:hypothetical protein